MREPNDLKLAKKTPPGLIDLILGGHDHFYAHHFVNEVHVLRSGTDFRQLSYIEAWRKEDDKPGWDFDIVRRDVVRDIPEDKATIGLVEKLTSTLKHKLEEPIGFTTVPLDGRFTTVRTKESNLGNFVCDLMMQYYTTDCAIMASGTIRGDQIYPPGVLQLKDIMNCFPFEDPVVVLRIKGKGILSALENSVSLVPALEGRYPQVSNIQFKYNPHRPPKSRILWTRIGGEPLDLERDYTLATRGYMSRGKDGFESLLVKSAGGDVEEVVSEENGILISMIMRQYFMSLKVLGRWRRWGPDMNQHWNGVQARLHIGGKVRDPDRTTTTTTTTHDPNPTLDEHESPQSPPHGHHVDSDTDDERVADCDRSKAFVPTEGEKPQADKRLARKVVKKWTRLAGVRRDGVATVEGEEEGGSGAVVPHWTRGIAPRFVLPFLSDFWLEKLLFCLLFLIADGGEI